MHHSCSIEFRMDANDLGAVDEADWGELVVACSKTCAVARAG
jgi:hypothetical protein